MPNNEEESRKVSDFIVHLLNNPNIKDEPLLIGEGLLLNFIAQNAEKLKITFKNPQFFPDLEWNEVLQLLLSNIYEKVKGEVLPIIDEFIDTTDFEGLNKISATAVLPADFHREKFHNFIDSIFPNPNKDVRYNFNSVINIYKYKIIEKYITEIFNRRDFLYNEIVRVQKTNLECDEYIVYLKVLLLVKNAAYRKIQFGESKIDMIQALKIPGKFPKYMADLTQKLRQQLPNLSEKSIQLALKSNFKEEMTDVEDGSSRLLFILSSRFHKYIHIDKVDRGAESPDKSWFAIAMKNAGYYGFNKRMLEDLYRISGDNNW